MSQSDFSNKSAQIISEGIDYNFPIRKKAVNDTHAQDG